MKPALSKLALSLELWAAEGPRAFLDRLADRRRDAARRKSFRPVALADFAPSGGGRSSWSLVHLLAGPPWRRLGGVEQHFLERWPEEAALGSPVALFPDGPEEPGGTHFWRLEGERGGERISAGVPGPVPGDETPGALATFLRAMIEHLGAPAAHLEGLAGWSVSGLEELSALATAHPVFVSLHDFAALCSRPQLIEEPVGVFCDYCRDLERCGRCLAAGGRFTAEEGTTHQARHRAAAQHLLAAARGVIFPSPFLRDVHRRFHGAAALPQTEVIEPAPPAPDAPAITGARPARGSLHAAFVGRFVPHKGAHLFLEIVERLAASRAGIRFSVWGGGDREGLRRARRLGVEVHGYYPAGALPGRLARARVDLVLLLSIWPEPFGRTLEEAASAGIPALVIDHGALADRVRAGRLGWTVPLPRENVVTEACVLLERLAGDPTALDAAIRQDRAAGAPSEPRNAHVRRAARRLLDLATAASRREPT